MRIGKGMLRALPAVGLCLLLGSGCRSTPGGDARDAAAKKVIDAAEEAEIQRRAKAHALYASGIVQEVNRETDAALKSYVEAVRLDPGNEELLADVCRRFLQNQQPQKVVDLLEVPEARTSASPKLLAQLGFAYAAVGKQDKARATYEQAVKTEPLFFPAHQQLFLTYLQAQQKPEALAALDAGSARADLSDETLIGFAELYLALATQWPEQVATCRSNAVALLKRADSLKPEELSVRLTIADHFSGLGENQRAVELYLEALQGLSSGSELRERLHAKLTALYLRNNETEKANEQLEAIVRRDPTNPQAHYFMGIIAMEQKQPEKAIEPFQRTILLKPEFEQAYFDLANAQLSAGKPQDALATVAKARAAFQPSFILEYLTAVAYTREKDYTSAMAHFTTAEVTAQASDPKRLDQFFYFQYGAANERAGHYDQAEALFEKALELDPEFHEAKNYLGYMWAERGLKLERARTLIEEALKAEPENDAYLDSMGWVLFQMNQPKEALGYLLKAAELAEEADATVYDHLGDVHTALGDMEQAREAWKKSLEVEDNEKVRKKLEGVPGGEI